MRRPAHVEVVGHEADFLAFEVAAQVETYGAGGPGEVETDAVVAELLEGGAEGAVVGAVDVVGSVESLFGQADGEDGAAVGEDALDDG